MISMYIYIYWFKRILSVNTKGLGVGKLRRKPSPNITFIHLFIYSEGIHQWRYTEVQIDEEG